MLSAQSKLNGLIASKETKKGIYKKTTVNIILSGEKLNAFCPISGIRQGCLLSPFLFDIVPEVLAEQLGKKNYFKKAFRLERKN